MAPMTMHAVRVEIIERHLTGESLPTIAATLQLNLYTVRKFWRIYQAVRRDPSRRPDRPAEKPQVVEQK